MKKSIYHHIGSLITLVLLSSCGIDIDSLVSNNQSMENSSSSLISSSSSKIESSSESNIYTDPYHINEEVFNSEIKAYGALKRNVTYTMIGNYFYQYDIKYVFEIDGVNMRTILYDEKASNQSGYIVINEEAKSIVSYSEGPNGWEKDVWDTSDYLYSSIFCITGISFDYLNFDDFDFDDSTNTYVLKQSKSFIYNFNEKYEDEFTYLTLSFSFEDNRLVSMETTYLLNSSGIYRSTINASNSGKTVVDIPVIK